MLTLEYPTTTSRSGASETATQSGLNSVTPQQLFDAHTTWALKRAKSLIRSMNIEQRQLFPGQLEQAALLALWRCAERFDASIGVSFASYANSHLRGRIIDELRGEGPVWRSRCPQAKNVRSLDSVCLKKDTMFGQCIVTVGETLAAARGDDLEADDETRAIIGCLTEIEQVVVRGHLNEHSFGVIGKGLGLSESRICQIMKAARTKMAAEVGRRNEAARIPD